MIDINKLMPYVLKINVIQLKDIKKIVVNILLVNGNSVIESSSEEDLPKFTRLDKKVATIQVATYKALTRAYNVVFKVVPLEKKVENELLHNIEAV